MPHLWFDREAVEAAEFYTSIFDDSRINSTAQILDTPSGNCDMVGFRILGYDFMAISAGPFFRINPSVSFRIKCGTTGEADKIWKRLSAGGKVLMDFGEYPFSKKFGWMEDKYGVSWQVIYTEGDLGQRITPVLMFAGNVCGRAEEAVNFYSSIFPGAKAQVFARYSAEEKPEREGTVKYAQFILDDLEFGALDSAGKSDCGFNEAISFIINCKDQEEIDYYWKKLSAVEEAEQCGWIKDRYGISWQIIPANMREITEKKPERTIPAMLKMKKIVIADLIKAADER
jgi:predicted 3-demethylubiquinone-9 3-methyltransferase (glyoxalase superfamily)